MGLHIRRGFFAKYSKHITAAVAIFALVAQPMYGLVASQVANALTATVTTQQELKDAVAGTGAYAGTSTVVIDGTINTTEEIRVTRSLAIQGGAIHATFNLNGQNNSVIEADATMTNTVTISGTTISSNKSADLHGVNAYVTNVELNDVTINNSGRAAINVNGATVTTSNLSTAGNGKTNFLGVSYGVIDLAKGSGVTATPTLNVNGLMTHAENLLHVRYAVSGYSVTGTQAGQYYAASQALSNGLRLKAAPNTPVITAPASPVTDSNDVTVKWNAPTTAGNANAAARYDVTIAKTGEGPAVYPGVTAQELTLNDLGNGAYTVTVQAIAASGLRGGTDTHSFEVSVYNYTAADSTFLTAHRWVRSNNSSDMAANVRVPAMTTAVRFSFTNGTTAIANIAGSEHLQAGQWPNAAGAKQFRAYTTLPAGSYDVTAEYQVKGTWYQVSNSPAKTTVVDNPIMNITLPNDDRYVFRGGDQAIVRVRVSDKHESFDYVNFIINGTTYKVTRENTDLRQAGNYVIADITKASNWTPLPEGTYTATVNAWNKANGRASAVAVSTRSFIIDNTTPTVTQFTAPSLAADSVSVSAKVTDTNGVDRVKFYLGQPSGGVCKNNASALIEVTGVLGADDTYTASIPTAGLDGDYCVLVSARDVAANNSTPQFRAITLDNTAPTVTITSHTRNANGGYTINGTSNDGADVSVSVGGKTYTATPASDGTWSIATDPLSDGNYFATATSTDTAGNQGSSASYGFTASTPVVILSTAPLSRAPASALGDNDDDTSAEASAPFIAQLFTPGATDVLGAQDPEDSDVNAPLDSDKGVLGTTAQPTVANASGFMGLAWYWWLLILAALIGLWWLIAARRRRKDNDQ